MIPGALYTPTIRKTRGEFYTHQIDQSIRFNDNDSAYLTRTPGGAGNRRTWTLSWWVKRANIGSRMQMFSITASGGIQGIIEFDIGDGPSTDQLVLNSETTGTTALNWELEWKFRDPAAWYHFVVVYDTTQAITNDRVKVYVNGEQAVDGWDRNSTPAQNQEQAFNSTNAMNIGKPHAAISAYFDGYMAEIHFIDGQALDASSFGELKEGIWIPKKYTGSYGTNGFFLKGQDSANLGDDSSGNGNDFTSSGLTSADQMSDSPTFGTTSEGNHCTWNPLNVDASVTFSDGNLTVSTSGADPRTAGNLGGRIDDTDGYYFETVIDADASDACTVGIITDERANKLEDEQIHSRSGSFMWRSYSSGQFMNETSTETTQGTFNPGDVLGWFVKGSTLYVRKNNSNVVGDVVAGTGGMSISSGTYFFPAFTSSVGGSGTSTVTLKTAENLWSYTPPSGFKALNTKNLANPTAAVDPNKGSNPTNYFDVITYEGNGGGQRVGQFVPLTELYTIDNSVIFNRDDSSYLTKTFSTDGGDTWTLSAWIKRGQITTGNNQYWFSEAGGSGIGFVATTDTLRLYNGSTVYNSAPVYRDTSAWMHVVFSNNSGTWVCYVNGSQVSGFTGTAANFNRNNAWSIGRYYDGTNYFDGYMADFYWIDGQALAASDFGQTDSSTNRWIPKAYSGSYGTNGFFLEFGDSAALGDDTSGNTNDFTSSGLASTDQMTDTPTKNFAVWNSNDKSGSPTFSNGNLEFNEAAAGNAVRSTLGASSGKFYFEATYTHSGATDGAATVGIQKLNEAINGATSIASTGAYTYIYRDDGYIINNGTSTSGFTNFGTGDVIMVAIDCDNNKLWFGVNGTWEASGDPAAGTNPQFTGITSDVVAAYAGFQGGVGTQTWTAEFGQTGGFTYTPPTGFVALNNDNLQSTDAGLSALVWIKNRDAADNHMLFDAVRGATKDLHSNNYDAEVTNVNTLQRFLKNGFQIGNDVEVNTINESYVAWQWMVDSLSSSSNTDGSITSTVLANQDAGFSIITYTGTGSAGDSVGHGLGVTPAFVLTKNLAGAGQGIVYHKDLGATKYLILNSAGAVGTSSGAWNNTEPTNSIVTLGGGGFGTNNVGNGLVMYAFTEVEGFSKIGSYVGNGSSDGPFVYCGFRPAFIIGKNTASGTDNWWMWDTTRNTYNVVNSYLSPTTSAAQITAAWLDITSNGFKLRDNGNGMNTNAATIIFMAFADQPLKYANAR